MSNQTRQIIDATNLDTILKQHGIKLPKKPCCGRSSGAPVRYSGYLRKLGYKGKFAIRTNGVITEICDL